MSVIAAEPIPATPTALAPLEGIHIREATRADNAALLALTRATPMAGSIALRIDRDPDFFALLRARGDYLLYVATHEDQIIGSISAAIFRACVHGKPELVAHIGDLKVHPTHTGRRLAISLAAALEDHLRARKIDLCFNLVADGNQRVLTINQGRHGTPTHTPLCAFTVKELLPTPFPHRNHIYTITEATPADLTAVTTLRAEFTSNRSLARVPPQASPIPETRLESRTSTRTLIARHNHQPVATLTLADTSHLRRNILIGVTPTLRAALAILRLVPGIRTPRISHPVNVLYARHPGCADGHLPAFRALIQHARTIAFHRKVHFLSIGLHQRDPLVAALTGLPGFTFTSRISATSLLTPNRASTLIDTIPYEDFALV